MILLDNYNEGTEESEEYILPDAVDSLVIIYDGGRIFIHINDVRVYSNLGVGGDFSIYINKEPPDGV